MANAKSGKAFYEDELPPKVLRKQTEKLKTIDRKNKRKTKRESYETE